jgi:hypothetical protein
LPLFFLPPLVQLLSLWTVIQEKNQWAHLLPSLNLLASRKLLTELELVRRGFALAQRRVTELAVLLLL